MTRHMNMASPRGTTEVFDQVKKSNSKHTPSVPEENVPTGILISFGPTESDDEQNSSKTNPFGSEMDAVLGDSNGGKSDAATVPDLNGSRRLEAVEEMADDNPLDKSSRENTATQNDNQNATDSFKLCGYLDKLGEKGIIKTYKKRWFVFDNQRCMLCYYRSHEVVVPLGSIPIANATFSFNPADSERPGNFSITVEGRVYQLQAKDYHTKMYWLQELQERRKSYSQLRTSLARDSTKRSSMEPSTGLVSTKRMKEKGGDPWSGLPPLLQPVTMPMDAVGEDTAGTVKPGLSLSSIKMDLKNPIVGIKRWKSLHQESVPHSQTNSAGPSQPGTDCNVQAQPTAPIPKPRRKHLNTDTSFMRPTSILQRFSNNSSENSTEKCPKCAQMQAQLCSAQEELEMVDNEAKASQEVIQILHKQLTEGKIQQSTNVKFLECKTDQAKLTLMHRKDKQLVQLEQLLEEVKNDREAMKKDLKACQSKVAELEEQITMFQEMLVAKDTIVMDLTMKIGDLEKAPPVTASSADKTFPENPKSFSDQEYSDARVDGCSEGQGLPPVANAFYIDRHEYEKLKDACQAFETQNKFLNKEILELNELRTQDQLRENTYIEKLDEFEAELYKLQSKHCLLLNELKAPRREVTSMEDKDDLVSQLIEEAIQSRGGDVENPTNEVPGRELYDKYGFSENLDEEELRDAEDPLVTMAAEFQKRVDEIAMKHRSDENISHSVKWENFIISCRNRALVSTPELKSLVRSGIPHEHRARIWKECIERRVKKDMEEVGSCYYERLKTENHNTSNPAVKQIELDLLRTLPNNRHYDKITSPGIPKLRNVLLAYSVHNPAIGYCQGLNRLAAIALLYLEEEDVFWCLVCIIEHIMPMDYYSKTLIGSQTDQKVLKDLLAEKLPRLNAHLDQYNIDLSLVTFNWFITVFCDNIPAETMLRIWDTFLFEGDKVLFRYALAFFKVAEEKLIAKKDYLSIFATLRQLPNMMKDVKKISQIAFHDLNPFPKKNIMQKRFYHRRQVKQQLEELEAIRREFVPRHSQEDLLGSDDDDDDEDFETLEAPTPCPS